MNQHPKPTLDILINTLNQPGQTMNTSQNTLNLQSNFEWIISNQPQINTQATLYKLLKQIVSKKWQQKNLNKLQTYPKKNTKS